MSKLILELNEFNPDLFFSSIPKDSKVQDLKKNGEVTFKIPDNYESDFLEPWSQWVSIHLGKPCSEHGVKHLGDVAFSSYQQVWDMQPEQFGIIWGCLNSRSPDNKKIVYFPDPWTVTSDVSEAKLSVFIKFLRKAVTKRSSTTLKDRMLSTFDLCAYGAWSLIRLLPSIDGFLLRKLNKLGLSKINSSVIYAVLEYLLFKHMLTLSQATQKTDIFFANMIAHAQHYYWNTEKHYIVQFAIDLSEKMILLSMPKYNDVVVFNGLTQEYSGDKEQWHSWVPKGGWKYYINDYLNIECEVAPCMSYDANLYFKDELALDTAKSSLEQIRLATSNASLFVLEKNPTNRSNLFIRLGYYGEGGVYVLNKLSQTTLKDVFDLAAIRTGRHTQTSFGFGDVEPFCNDSNRNLLNYDSVAFYLR